MTKSWVPLFQVRTAKDPLDMSCFFFFFLSFFLLPSPSVSYKLGTYWFLNYIVLDYTAAKSNVVSLS